MEKLHNPSLTPSAQVMRSLQQRDQSFYEFAVECAQDHKKHFMNQPLSSESVTPFLREAKLSLEKQLRTEAEDGLAVPVRIRGPWASPGIAPDLEALAARRMELEKARLTEEAEKKISEQLGIEAKEGQTPEEALKEQLENELRKKLGLPPLSEE